MLDGATLCQAIFHGSRNMFAQRLIAIPQAVQVV